LEQHRDWSRDTRIRCCLAEGRSSWPCDLECGELTRSGTHEGKALISNFAASRCWGNHNRSRCDDDRRTSRLNEARDEKRLLRLQRQLASYKLLVVDELGYDPLSPTGAELLFETFSQRYERGSIIVTSNLPFDEWTSVFASERLTSALLDRLTHPVHILEMNGDSYRLKQSKYRPRADAEPADTTES
jgi:hypothetical protein